MSKDEWDKIGCCVRIYGAGCDIDAKINNWYCNIIVEEEILLSKQVVQLVIKLSCMLLRHYNSGSYDRHRQ